MAVDAVTSVVLQKLSDLLVDESFASNKIIGHRLKRLKEVLESTSSPSFAQDINIDYLSHLYSIEDLIESFALSFTSQRKKLGCLMNHALFLKKFTALKMLDSKLYSIQTKVGKQKQKLINGQSQTTSLERRDRSVHQISSSPINEEEETDGPGSSRMKRTKSSPSSVGKLQERPMNLRKNHSVKVLSRSHASTIRERWEEETDGPGSSRMKRTKSNPSSVGKLQERPINLRKNHSVKVLSRSHASTIRERWEEETDGPGSSMMKRTKSSPSSVGKLQERPINLRKNHSVKVLSRSHASTIRERWEQSRLMYSYSYNEELLSIVGYQGKVAELRRRLENPDDRIIPIVGALGSGKTMLARAIYGNRSIKNMFTPCAWANIFKESTTTDILRALLNQMNKSRVENGSCEISLKKRLSQELRKGKYLIVLDGVKNGEQWESLQDAFPHEESGNKIILTTCDNSYSKWQPYKLEVLNSEESWTLFMTKVGSQTDPEPSLKERIIQICRGLPLNIVLLGSLLSMKDSEKWSETLNIHGNWQTSEIMKLSYNDLDNHMKLCLIYMTLFPKELDIPVRRLQRLWLAEGFVEQPHKEGGKFQEDVALGYFENLVKRSLIMVSKQRSDGSARRCRLQGALHGLLVEQGREIHLFQVHHDHKSSAREHTRRLVEYADGGNSQLELSQFQKVRSYISFNFQKKDTPAKHVSSLVRKCKLLRVLDLEGVYQPSLPENLGDLFHLRYLGLRWTFLEKLPKSVGELPHLQTLDLKHTRIEKIPTSIWKLKTLQHLNLDEVHLDKDTLLHLRRSLPELLTLWGLSVTHQSPIQNGLNKLRHLRELGITFRFIKKNNNIAQDAGQSKALVVWISRLIHLRSLRLRSIDDSGNPLDLSLEPLSSLGKLSHMKLLGRLQQLPPLGHFPPHIKVLTLSLSYLSKDPMPILGQLPDLTVLRLLGNSYLGETMVCSSGRFKNLEVLKLWMLEDLKKWEVEDGAMEKLKEVNIRRCSKMESFPINLLKQKSFQDLILNNMPPAFKEKIGSKYLFKVATKDYEFES